MNIESIKAFFMRFSLPATALAVTLSLVSSVSFAATDYTPNAASNALVSKGITAQEAGENNSAYDFYESALVYDPRNLYAYVGMAIIAEADGLYGKALRLYDKALKLDENNADAIAGQGRVYVAKGATRKAKENLAKLEVICGNECSQAKNLAGAIESGPPAPPISVATKDVEPQPEITEITE